MSKRPNSPAPAGFPIWVESHLPAIPSDWHKLEDGLLIDRSGSYWRLADRHPQSNRPLFSIDQDSLAMNATPSAVATAAAAGAAQAVSAMLEDVAAPVVSWIDSRQGQAWACSCRVSLLAGRPVVLAGKVLVTPDQFLEAVAERSELARRLDPRTAVLDSSISVIRQRAVIDLLEPHLEEAQRVHETEAALWASSVTQD